MEHGQFYEEWCQTQEPCQNVLPTTIHPLVTSTRPLDADTNSVQTATSQRKPTTRRASAPCLKDEPAISAPEELKIQPAESSEPLERVMKGQNRAFRPTKHNVSLLNGGRVISNDLYPWYPAQVNVRPRTVRLKARKEKNGCTTPKPSDDRERPGAHTKPVGPVMEPMSAGMVPNELLKMPTKPLGEPLVMSDVGPPIQPITDNELIVNKLEAIEEKRDPEREHGIRRRSTQGMRCADSVRLT